MSTVREKIEEKERQILEEKVKKCENQINDWKDRMGIADVLIKKIYIEYCANPPLNYYDLNLNGEMVLCWPLVKYGGSYKDDYTIALTETGHLYKSAGRNFDKNATELELNQFTISEIHNMAVEMALINNWHDCEDNWFPTERNIMELERLLYDVLNPKS